MPHSHRIFLNKLQHLYRSMGVVHLQGTLLSSMICGFLLREQPLELVAAWFILLQVSLIYHHYLGRRINAQVQRACNIPMSLLLAAATLAGLAWGSAGVFIPFVSPPLQWLLVMALTLVGTASFLRLPLLPALHRAFLLGLALPLLPPLLLVFGSEHWLMLLAVLSIWVGIVIESRRAADDLSEIYDECDFFRQESLLDRLTGIPNRRAFDDALEREWRSAQRLRLPLSLVIIDVDFFKKYNDRYGHPMGDEVLRAVAKVLNQGVRRASDLVARYGGEEFVILLFHTPRVDACALAEKLRRSVESMEICHADGIQGRVTLSLGGATLIPNTKDEPEAFIKSADAALYEAKHRGRNQVCWAAMMLPKPMG